MYLHLWGGLIIMIIGLIQILPLLRTEKLFILHRIIGTMVCFISILTSIGGNIFIYTTGTVGGINMDIAFSIYGWLLFIFSLMAYIRARTNNRQAHKDWALRLWALIYASLFYRISYFMLSLCGYHVTNSSDFFRPIDELLDWWFFLVPLFVMEIYIRLNNYRRNKIVEYTILYSLERNT